MKMEILNIVLRIFGFIIGLVESSSICKLCWCIDTSILCGENNRLSSFDGDDLELQSSNISFM